MAAADTPDSAPHPRPDRPDPTTATDLVGFVALLNELRRWASAPDEPAGYKKLEGIANAHPRVRPGVLSSSTMHRILSGRQDLAFARDSGRFVEALVITLGVDPAPWIEVLDRLLLVGAPPADADRVTGVPPAAARSPARQAMWRRQVAARKMQVIAVVLVLLTVGLVTSAVAGQERPVATAAVDYSRPVGIESASTGLRLAIDQNSDQPGGRGVVLDRTNAATTSWDIVAPYRDNPDYRQLRPTGKLLMCLEVLGGSFDDRAAVQQWGCNGEQHQYWRALAGPSGILQFTNLKSGQCLSVASARPQAGMQLVQRECDERQQAQQWRVVGADPPAGPPRTSTTAVVPAAVGPDPGEYPDGGKDRPCDGDGMTGLHAGSTQWSTRPFLVKDEDATRGAIALGPGGAGAVYLQRAERTTPDGVAETFYWAEGFVKFTPVQFTMSLQWTSLPGPGGWHTCAVDLAAEHQRLSTVALPRDLDGDGRRDVWFRVCLAYRPVHTPDRVVNCAGRY